MTLLIDGITHATVGLVGGLTKRARSESERFTSRHFSPTLDLLNRSVHTQLKSYYPFKDFDKSARTNLLNGYKAVEYRFLTHLNNSNPQTFIDCIKSTEGFLNSLSGEKEIRFHIPRKNDADYKIDITAADLVHTLSDLGLFTTNNYDTLNLQEILKRKNPDTLNNLEEEIINDASVIDHLISTMAGEGPNLELFEILIEQAMVLEYAKGKIKELTAQPQQADLV